ncbi:hypothetical protein AYI70_g571 [Smittium culicis]|uniref:Uncharacterized protein n=1 Tax=Smittium culicis TaxID=133412 RepID=A0A1R1YG82_9FUNG|nr:hypothetical protein AYI70_g571 [Smittium culicis]
MIKGCIKFVALVASIGYTIAQSTNVAKINWFKTGYSGSYTTKDLVFGQCDSYNGVDKIFIGAINDAELSIYSGYSCTNLVATKKLCGLYSNMNMVDISKITYYSIKIESKPGICRYRRKKENCD